MYVYCTEEVPAGDIQLKELIKRLEQGDRILLNQLFDIRYPYWKRNFDRRSRLVGELRYLGEVPVLILFGLYSRGSHEYREFLDRRKNSDYRDRIRNLVPEHQLRAWLERRRNEEIERERLQNDLPDLPEELYSWTEFLNVPNYRKRLVLESGEWVRQVLTLTPEQLRQAYRAVLQLVEDEEGKLYHQLPRFHPGAEVRHCQEGGIHIAVSLVQVCEQQGSWFPFLIGIYDHVPEQRERFELGKQTQLFGVGADHPHILQHPQPLEVWKQYARRAYPDYMVADETIWLQMQENAEGNFALSMEEEEVLQSRAMPLLINGRAGSGKSLMLYYRFAEYCSHYLKIASKEAPQYQPLFLTYSPSLVQQARNKVSTILRVNHSYRQDGHNFSPEEIKQCRAFFSTFQDYLLSCLSPQQQSHYQPDRYVNFYRFRKWYRGRARVEVAWHTIRTLIKGYEVSGYLDPDSYQELPKNDRTVDDQVFEEIYNEVWSGYRERTTHEGWWDDQDLVRDVLENGTLNPIHPVIFCDEVQDFTQLELNVIFCLSPWGKYRLDWAVERLPYAFAGDPMQTINPTGFRWSALKKYLYEHIRAYLHPNHPFEIEGPQELRNNYRCSPQITRFSNVVNLWRRVISRNPEIYPQHPWRPQEHGNPVQKFVLNGQDRNLTQQEIRSILNNSTGVVCILPCSLGEELDYIRQDRELKNLFAEELEQNIKPAVLQTVMAVKGMEFKKVIVYKFGEHYRHRRSLRYYAENAGEEVSLQLHYFLNQLYVAITRPIEALAIMDTSEGWQEFWDANLEIEFWLHHPSLAQDRERWKTHPTLLDSSTQVTNIKYWTDTNLQDVGNLAFEFLKRGLAEGNIELIEDARAFARQMENPTLEQECQAWIGKLQRNYVQAGHRFLGLEQSVLPDKNPKREAWECFWTAKAWSELQHYYSTFTKCPDIPDYGPLVDLMVVIENKSTKLLTRFPHLVQVRDWLSIAVSPENRDDKWDECVKQFLTEFRGMLNSLKYFCPKGDARNRFLQRTYKSLVGRMAFLGQRQGVALEYHEILATCHFHLEQYEKAVDLWEHIQHTNHSSYYRAKIHLVPFPSKIKWLIKNRQDFVVVSSWQEAGHPLTGEWEEYVHDIMTSLERLQEWTLLIRVLIQRHEWEKLWERVKAHPQAWQQGHDYELVAQMARDSQTNWEELLRKSPQLREFLQKVVSSLRQEVPPCLQPLEVGLALERLGYYNHYDYRETLSFYWRFANDRTGKILEQQRSQIRQRWLLINKKYQNFLQERWGEQLPQAEPKLDPFDPWACEFVEHPSPVQSWLV